MAQKRRVTLYLDPEIHASARALVDSLPGASLSGIVDELLADYVPVVQSLMDAAKSGDKDAKAEMFSRLLADQLVGLATEGTSVVRQLVENDKDGDETE